jgi:hypothetical protein
MTIKLMTLSTLHHHSQLIKPWEVAPSLGELPSTKLHAVSVDNIEEALC